MAQKQSKKPKADVPQADVQAKQDQHNKDVEDLLDEIDDVLEENAEEFVRSYVQKGGQ